MAQAAFVQDDEIMGKAYDARLTRRLVGYLRPYLRTPTYHASWQLQGFEPADWEQPGSDRLADAMVATQSAAANGKLKFAKPSV